MPKTKEAEAEKLLAERKEQKLLEETTARAEISQELASHIQHVPNEPEITAEMDQIGAVNPAQAATQVLQTGPTITLSLTEEEIKKGLHHKIVDSIRWLAEWCVKIAKAAHRHGIKVIFGRK